MKRGAKFFNELTATKQGGGGKKGRSLQLLAIRNEKIFYRYYYYSLILHYKYEVVLMSLSSDFDLSESTLIQLLEKHTMDIKQIKDKKLSRAELKRLYPVFSWNGKASVPEARERPVFVLK